MLAVSSSKSAKRLAFECLDVVCIFFDDPVPAHERRPRRLSYSLDPQSMLCDSESKLPVSSTAKSESSEL